MLITILFLMLIKFTLNNIFCYLSFICFYLTWFDILIAIVLITLLLV